ncbi:hypothetical protein D3C81_2131130 [compost metagenome]
MTTGHHYAHQAGAGLAGDFGIGQLFLHLLHFFLHLLGLFHQACHATFHHGDCPQRSRGSMVSARTWAPNCSIIFSTSGSLAMDASAWR